MAVVGPSREQRAVARSRVADAYRSELRVLTEADIPPGSVLSDETLEAIRAGHYAMRVPLANPPRGEARRLARRQALRKLSGS